MMINDNALTEVRRIQRARFDALMAETCADGQPMSAQNFYYMGMQPNESHTPVRDWFESLDTRRASGVLGMMQWHLPTTHPDYPSPTPSDVI